MKKHGELEPGNDMLSILRRNLERGAFLMKVGRVADEGEGAKFRVVPR